MHLNTSNQAFKIQAVNGDGSPFTNHNNQADKHKKKSLINILNSLIYKKKIGEDCKKSFGLELDAVHSIHFYSCDHNREHLKEINPTTDKSHIEELNEHFQAPIKDNPKDYLGKEFKEQLDKICKELLLSDNVTPKKSDHFIDKKTKKQVASESVIFDVLIEDKEQKEVNIRMVYKPETKSNNPFSKKTTYKLSLATIFPMSHNPYGITPPTSLSSEPSGKIGAFH